MRLRTFLIEYEAKSHADAVKIFLKYGMDPQGKSVDEIKTQYRTLLRKFHPDLNHDPQAKYIAQEITVAYDFLKQFNSSQKPSEPSKPTRPTSNVPEWAWAGYSGGSPPAYNIYKNDYTDMNYIKKRMWELSGESMDQWTILGFDGHFFRNSITVFAAPHIRHIMAKAMVDWQTKGGNPYPCRAVFMSERNRKTLYLIYLDGRLTKPLPMSHNAMNANPANDLSFMHELPNILDNLANDSKTWALNDTA